MNYIGDFSEDSTVRIALTTNNTSGAAVAPSSAFEAADFVIYKNGSATQKTTTNGITCTSPFDSVVGLHILEIDTSNDTGDSGFWTAAADYWVVAIPDETINSQTVVQVVATFSIENRIRVKSTDQVSLATGAITAAVIATDAIDADAIAASAVTEIQSGLATAAGVSAVETDTQDIQARLPAALVSGRIDASVGAMASGVLTATAIGSNAITSAKIAASAIGASQLAAGCITSSELDATAITAIQAGLATAANVSAVETDTQDIQSRLPATLQGGTQMICYVASIDDDVITASALAADAVFEIQSGLATSSAVTTVEGKVDIIDTNVDTLLARITSTLFSGITYLSRWLGAIAGKTADTTTRTEINATTAGAGYNETTDSQEAIRDRGDAAWTTGDGGGGGAGTGARTVTVTVNDGATAIQSATVRMTAGAETYTATTNVSGVATFNLDDATYTVAITKSGYSYAGTTLVVDGDESATYSMTVITITPSSGSLVTGYWTCYSELGAVESGVTVTLYAIRVPTESGLAIDSATRTATSAANGVAQFTNLIPGATYRVKRGSGDYYTIKISDTATGTVALNSILGT